MNAKHARDYRTRNAYTDANGIRRFAGSNALVPDTDPRNVEIESIYRAFGVDSRDRCERDYCKRAERYI